MEDTYWPEWLEEVFDIHNDEYCDDAIENFEWDFVQDDEELVEDEF